MNHEWCREECQELDLGDVRRTAVVRRILAAAAAAPGGMVSRVMKSSAGRQAAYKFLESEHTAYKPLLHAFASATARRAREKSFVFVPVDGSSLSLTDRAGTKFGAVGATSEGGRGMKVITAYAVDEDGVPVGVLNQQWWARLARKRASRPRQRRFCDRETTHWCDAIDAAKEALASHAPGTSGWFVIDREGDGFHVLSRLEDAGQFTVRSNANRRVRLKGGKVSYVNDVLAKQPLFAVLHLDLPATPKRAARRVRLHARVTRIELDLRDSWSSKKPRAFPVTVVDLREVHTTPEGEKPVHWRLYTHLDVKTAEDLDLVVKSYRTRWRIEEFHRTWKTGGCDVESSQLRSQKSLLLWATIMATVAARVERLKVLSRKQPDAPPETEFSRPELQALVLLHNIDRKRTEPEADRVPSLEVATRWVADLGGYTGKSSGGPPGATTILRGLETLAVAVKTIQALERAKK